MGRVSAVRTLAFASALAAATIGGVVQAGAASTPLNVDVSRWQYQGQPSNESEEAIAVNPTNPNNIVMVTNVDIPEAGMFEGVSFDGGKTWPVRRLIGNNDNLGDACCDPSLAFDKFGNLYLSYLYNTEIPVPVALSTDGGLTFNIIANIKRNSTDTTLLAEKKNLFRYTDQETITTGPASDGSNNEQVWLVVSAAGPIVATGAVATGLGQVGSFSVPVEVPGTNNCTYGDVSIGPKGQVANVCTTTESGQGGGKLNVSVDPDGLGPAPFGASVFVTDTHVGGFDFIPPQPDRSVDAEPGLAWDRSGSAHRGRLYLVYTLEVKNESDNTDVMLRYSDNQGATWSAPLRVNDDATKNSQFMPKISLDQTTGNLAFVWYDSRKDLGLGGSGDTDGLPDTDAQFWGAFSVNGGASVTRNFQISAGTSNSHASGNHIDYGDYTGLSFYGGIAHPGWSDNSNSTGDNPDGTLHQLDVFSAAVPVRSR